MLNLLLFSDLHSDRIAAEEICRRAATVDLVIGAGDFATGRRNLSRCIDVLRAIDRPTVLVAGNNETTDELRHACRGWSRVHILHGTEATIGQLTLYGIGGGIPVTPFGAWSYDFSELEATALLAACPPRCVLVSHSPPYGVVDRSSRGAHLGSQAMYKTVVRAQPQLVVCGHIHASAGQQGMIGATPVINAGPHGVEWRLAPLPASN
jgi:Icc-related predicted phosphoesterase